MDVCTNRILYDLLLIYLFILFYLLLNRTQGTKKNKRTDINDSGNHRVHKPVINHAMSSVLNRWEQSSGLSLNSKKSLDTETFANISVDTLDK